MASDYDGAWKDLLHARLKAALWCYFPAIALAIDWSFPPEFLDQELRELAIDEVAQDNRVDLLVKVRTIDGRSQLLYLHIEVQSFREERFPLRVFRYFHGIRSACGEDVVTLIILADLDSDWRPQEYRYERLGCEVVFRFPCCKLLDILPELENDHSLPALAAKAQIAALRTSRSPDQRLSARWKLTRSLYDSGYNKEEIREAYRLIAWMMKLPPAQTLLFRRQVTDYERETAMPLLTDVEESAMEEGRQEGRQEAVLEILADRFQEVPESLETAIRSILDSGRLRILLKEALHCEDLAAFLAGLEQK